MSKIEEILKNKGITPTTKFHNYEYLYKAIQESMIEFGKICFKAGGEIKDGWTNVIGQVPKYENYEDFLKEIEDETGN